MLVIHELLETEPLAFGSIFNCWQDFFPHTHMLSNTCSLCTHTRMSALHAYLSVPQCFSVRSKMLHITKFSFFNFYFDVELENVMNPFGVLFLCKHFFVACSQNVGKYTSSSIHLDLFWLNIQAEIMYCANTVLTILSEVIQQLIFFTFVVTPWSW